jgi:hypothetical protein
VTEVMPPTRRDEYLPCSGPIRSTPLATVADPSVPLRVARKWHDARSSFRRLQFQRLESLTAVGVSRFMTTLVGGDGR